MAGAVMAVLLAGCGSDHHGKRSVSVSTSVSSPPALPAPAGIAFGLNVNRLFNDGTYSPAQINAELAAVRATGVTVARSDALWELTEPAAPVKGVHVYDWRFDDRIAAALAAHDLTWLPIIDYAALWDVRRGALHGPPESFADYAAFAAAFARRFGPGGAFWAAHPELVAHPVGTVEIWNEPDNRQFWAGGSDPAAYAALYIAARDAITAVAPAIRVLVGGLTDPPATLSRMLRAHPELAGHIDGVAVHPYGLPLEMIGKLRDDRATMDALGLGSVPLYVTEFGWVTRPRGALGWVPADRRPQYIRAALAALGHTDCGISQVYFYTWITPERDPNDREDWFGIQPPGGGPSADKTAFVAGLQAAQAPAPTLSVCGS